MAARPTSAEIDQRLFNTAYTPSGTDYEKLLFEQYKLYIEMMDKVSERRTGANTFFVTLNTGILAAFGVVIGAGRESLDWVVWLVLAVIAMAGIPLCHIWERLIKSYDELNTGKFAIIHRLETKLPALLYDTEWLALGEGSGEFYKPLSHVERGVPRIFIKAYYALAVGFFAIGIIMVILALMGAAT